MSWCGNNRDECFGTGVLVCFWVYRDGVVGVFGIDVFLLVCS